MKETVTVNFDKPLKLDPVQDKKILEEKYNLILDIDNLPEEVSIEALLQTFEKSFELEFDMFDFLFSYEEFPDFDTFYNLWKNKEFESILQV